MSHPTKWLVPCQLHSFSLSRFFFVAFFPFFFFKCAARHLGPPPVHHRVCVSLRNNSHPAPLSVFPLAVPRVRLLKLMAQRRSSYVPSSQPLCFRRLPLQRVDKEGAKRRTFVLEVRCTGAVTSTYHALPESVAVGDCGGSSESGSTSAKNFGDKAASLRILLAALSDNRRAHRQKAPSCTWRSNVRSEVQRPRRRRAGTSRCWLQ